MKSSGKPGCSAAIPGFYSGARCSAAHASGDQGLFAL